uniref:Uncharacterized protein n=1 Tax=Strongyloides stercoralis TaxID=6248 RepID=A0A0K0EGR0_STRER
MRFLKEILLFLTTVLINLNFSYYLNDLNGHDLVPHKQIQQNDLSIADDGSKLTKSDLLNSYISDSDKRQKRQAKKQRSLRKGRKQRGFRQQRSRRLRRLQGSRRLQKPKSQQRRRQSGLRQGRRLQTASRRRNDEYDYNYDDDEYDCPDDVVYLNFLD